MFFLFPWILGAAERTPSDASPVDSFLQGLVGACAVSVLCSFMRVYYFIQACSDSETETKSRRKSPSPGSYRNRDWISSLQFWSLAVLLSLVGSRVSSLIVLEFSLRAVSAWMSSGLDASGRGSDLLLVLCQFSLGCGLSCTMAFLHEGAPHSTFALLLAAALSWALAGVSHNLWAHVARLFPLHSAERYCGKCINLLSSGHSILTTLQRVVIVFFTLAAVASTSTVYDHFLSQKDAMKFWIPLTLCYTMLVVHMQEDQNRHAGPVALLHTVVLRLGALLVLMLTVGDWSDVFHVLVTFLGEAVCLLPSKDLLQAALKEEEDTQVGKHEPSSSHRARESLRPSSLDGR